MIENDLLELTSLKGRLLLEIQNEPVVKGPSALSICQTFWPNVKTKEQCLAKINDILINKYNVKG